MHFRKWKLQDRLVRISALTMESRLAALEAGYNRMVRTVRTMRVELDRMSSLTQMRPYACNEFEISITTVSQRAGSARSKVNSKVNSKLIRRSTPSASF